MTGKTRQQIQQLRCELEQVKHTICEDRLARETLKVAIEMLVFLEGRLQSHENKN